MSTVNQYMFTDISKNISNNNNNMVNRMKSGERVKNGSIVNSSYTNKNTKQQITRLNQKMGNPQLNDIQFMFPLMSTIDSFFKYIYNIFNENVREKVFPIEKPIEYERMPKYSKIYSKLSGKLFLI